MSGARFFARTAFAVAGALALVAGQAKAAATFVIVNNDPAGVGFNDPTPAAPVGGNPGTTVGQQRLNAFNYAANVLWGSRLTSTVPIVVHATFGPLACTADSGTVGFAGPTSILSFPVDNGPVLANTYVALPLGEKIKGSDNNAGAADINAQFNGNVGKTGCLEGGGWYLGYDGKSAFNQTDFVSILLHELGHGLGFLTFVNKTTGAQVLIDFNPDSKGDIYSYLLYDNAQGKYWRNMTNAERVTSITTPSQVVFGGANAVAGTGPVTSGKDGDGWPMVYTPSPLNGGSNVSHWTQDFDCVSCANLLPLDLMKPLFIDPVHTTFLTHLAFQDMGWGTVKSGSGDANSDAAVSVSDVLYLINNLFAGGPAPILVDADVNKDGQVNVSDVLYLINYLFAGGPAPI